MRISKELFVLFITIFLGATLLITVNFKKERISQSINYENKCTELAASGLDKPPMIPSVDYDEIKTGEAIDACNQALAANPSSNRLKYYLARSHESSQTLEDLLKAKEILVQLSEAGYAPANYELYLFADYYTELQMPLDEYIIYLKSAADSGLERAIADYIYILNDEDSPYFDPVTAQLYKSNAVADINTELFKDDPNLFVEKLNQWQICYATILAPTGSTYPSLIFYKPGQISLASFVIPDSSKVSPAQRKNAIDVCKELGSKTPTNARDLALQLLLPFLLHNEQLDANKILFSLKKNQSLPDFAFLVDSLSRNYINQNSKYISKNLKLEEYLLNAILKSVNSNDLNEFAQALFWVEELESRGLLPGYATLLKSPDFLKKFKLVDTSYPEVTTALIYLHPNSFANISTFYSSAFSMETKFNYFCELIAEVADDKSVSFSVEKLKNHSITGFGEEDKKKLANFCVDFANEKPSSSLNTVLFKEPYEGIFNTTGVMDQIVQKISNEYDKSGGSAYYLYKNGEFKKRNLWVNEFVKGILPHYELGDYDDRFLTKALISKEFLANPLMLLDYATEVDRKLGKNFTEFATSYLSDNFRFYLPDNFVNSKLTCSERFESFRSIEPLDASQNFYFFDNIYVELNLDKIIDLNLKERTLSISLTTNEKTLDVNLLAEENYFCQDMLMDKNGKPTSVTTTTYNDKSKNPVTFDFRSTIGMPELLFSSLYIENNLVHKEFRSNLKLSFDPDPLKLHLYPFINGQIVIPLDLVAKDQDGHYLTLDVKDKFNKDISGLNVNLKNVKFSERDNYPNAIQADIFLEVQNKYLIQLLKIVFPILVLASVALTTLPRQRASSDEAQLALASAVMLSIVAYQFVVNALLPELPFLTALDYFIYALFLSAALSVISNVLLHIEYFDTHESQERFLVLVTNSGAILFYLAGIIVLTIAWFQSVH